MISIRKQFFLLKRRNLNKEVLYCYYSKKAFGKFKFKMDYKKKSLKNLNSTQSYEEIDTRLASGWYVDSPGKFKKKRYKTDKVSFKISKKSD